MTDRDLFIAALERPDPAARGAWLTEACPDAETRRRVEILLRAHDQASKFLAMPAGNELAADAPTQTGHPGDETTPAAEIDVRAFLAPSETPGHLGRLGHFEILEIVGRGGMGVVLKALDPKLHRLVAVKLMSPHLAASSAARRRFEREAKAVAAVKNEYVVAIHDVHPDAAAPYLVMEFVSGPSLQDRLERAGPLAVKEVLRIGLQAACGLAAAHKQGLVHRDVKPANILLENGVERVKLTDFGLARAADDANLTQSGVITGTPNYMSPEQANGSPVDARSDLFSLGSVLYALCAGHPPFRADTAMAVLKRVCEDAPRPLPEVNPDVPPWLDAIVRKLLAKAPADRFQTAPEVAELLGHHLAHLQNPAAVTMPAAVVLPVPNNSDADWKEIFSGTDRARRAIQLNLLIVGIALVMATPILTRTGREIPFLLPVGLGMFFVASLIHKKWAVPYKGRTIRFEQSVVHGMRLFVDAVRIASDQVRPRTELRGTVPPGPGAGDEIRADVEVGFARVSCRIFVREVRPAPIAVPAPALPAPAPEIKFRIPERPPVAGCLVVVALLALAGSVLAFRDTIGRLVFLEGYFALGFFALAVGIAGVHGLIARWGKTRGSRLANGLAAAIVLIGAAIGQSVWFEYRGDRAKAFDAVLWSLAGLWASVVVTNGYLVVCRRPTNDPANARRVRLFGGVAALGFGAAAVVTVQQLVPESDDQTDRLVVKWNHAFADHVTIERDGQMIGEFRSTDSAVGYPYHPTGYTIRGFLRDEPVYREVVRLESGKARNVSLFDDRKWPAEPVLHVRSEDPGLRFTLTSADHDLSWSGASEIKQPLVAGSSYEFQVARGSTVVCSEPIKLDVNDGGYGDTRFLYFPRLGGAPRTTDLRPLDGSFPPDVIRMAFSPDGTLVAVARLDGPVLVFDTATGRERFTVRRRKSDCPAVGFTPDSKALAYVDAPETGPKGVQFVSVADGQVRERLVPGPEHGLTNSHALAFSPDGKRLAVGSATNVGGRYRFQSRVLRWELPERGPAKQLPPFDAMPGTVSSLLFSPDGQTVRAAGGAEEPFGWDWKDGAMNQVMQHRFRDRGVGDYVNALAPGPTADLILSNAYSYATVDLWTHGAQATSYRQVAMTRLDCGAMAASPDGRRVAVGLKGVGLGPWQSRAAVDVFAADGPPDPQTGNRRHVVRLLGHTDWVMAVRFSPDGKVVMSASKDGTVRTWQMPE